MEDLVGYLFCWTGLLVVPEDVDVFGVVTETGTDVRVRVGGGGACDRDCELFEGRGERKVVDLGCWDVPSFAAKAAALVIGREKGL